MPIDGESLEINDTLLLVNDVQRAFGLGTVRSIAALGGTAARKWSVTTAAGRYVVRIRPPEFAQPGNVRFDHTILLRLAMAGLPVPRPLATPAGEPVLRREGESIEVLSWIEGEPWSAKVAGAAFGVGAFLACFHTVAAGEYPAGKLDQLREDHPDALQSGLDVLIARTVDPDSKRRLESVSILLEQGRRELEASLYASLPHAVIHGDIHPGNLRFLGADVAALYDFDYLSVQARARDLVDALIFFASERSLPLEPDDIRSLTQTFVPNLAASKTVLAGYQSVSRLTDREWRALPLLMRSRWIQMRLRGSRKVPASEQADFVLHNFSTVLDWIQESGPEFFVRLRNG